MPLFGRKTKYAEDAHQAKSGQAHDPRDTTTGKDGTLEHRMPGGMDIGDSHSNSGLGAGDKLGNNSDIQGLRSGVRGSNPDNRGDGQFGSGLTPEMNPAGVNSQISSATLREEGVRLEREAEALHKQSAEVAEAERLEQEAREHRERAIASGANPIHRQPMAGPGSSHREGPN
ncbi:hypothetical protein BXZ70DRAFT_1060505 [Cristinia sonorae]|uniref:Uncharacterized protein n=1 Tax=Cristinia sonorae TaxID=1940300 RepID=A0A8K0XUQ6_9AGAR|nr:hypothetical protein BXZ70DRAFT_1060505 [Cristinia sonorae]